MRRLVLATGRQTCSRLISAHQALGLAKRALRRIVLTHLGADPRASVERRLHTLADLGSLRGRVCHHSVVVCSSTLTVASSAANEGSHSCKGGVSRVRRILMVLFDHRQLLAFREGSVVLLLRRRLRGVAPFCLAGCDYFFLLG